MKGDFFMAKFIQKISKKREVIFSTLITVVIAFIFFAISCIILKAIIDTVIIIFLLLITCGFSYFVWNILYDFLLRKK